METETTNNGDRRNASGQSNPRPRLGKEKLFLLAAAAAAGEGDREGPLCYLLAVDGFRFLPECGWIDLCDPSNLQPLTKYSTRSLPPFSPLLSSWLVG
uniref:Uncharacterized protein n=1 Tax=Oryza punctata TaxID=4537 RepID=A0A0E0JK29_ORYPU